MSNAQLGRRELLTAGTAIIAAGAARAGEPGAPAPQGAAPPNAMVSPGSFLLGLNTSTLRGHKLSIVEEIAIGSKSGYRGMEPWVDELEQYAASGKSLADLKKQFGNAGISVESAIGFFEWIVDDPARRQKALETARRNMELVAKVGGKRLAAPPVGATNEAMPDLRRVAERYRDLLELGDQMGVVPQVEVWGFSRTLGRLGEAALVAMEAHHVEACILPDVYHLYRGGSGLNGIKLLAPRAIHVFHINDYPADPPREKLSDADRVYPGDGVAPLRKLLRDLADGGFRVMLSLELFNRRYWSQDPMTVARTGFEKMNALVTSVRTR
jgi:2-keto-myo-inositol isomerase